VAENERRGGVKLCNGESVAAGGGIEAPLERSASWPRAAAALAMKSVSAAAALKARQWRNAAMAKMRISWRWRENGLGMA